MLLKKGPIHEQPTSNAYRVNQLKETV